MEDERIVELFWSRDQSAIEQANRKYGKYCYAVAYRILSSHRDSEECVNDTWHKAWQAIPPEKPAKLQSFLGRITRNLALDRYSYNTAKKRNTYLESVVDEYWQCVPGDQTPPDDALALKDLINRFVASLDKQSRIVFLQRYWYVCSAKEIGRNLGLTQSNVNVILHRTREKFKLYLQKEGISV